MKEKFEYSVFFENIWVLYTNIALFAMAKGYDIFLDGPLEIMDFCFFVIGSIIAFVLPGLFWYIIDKNKDLHENEDINTKFKSLWGGIDLTRSYSSFFPIIQYYRKLVFCSILVFLSFDPVLQSMAVLTQHIIFATLTFVT